MNDSFHQTAAILVHYLSTTRINNQFSVTVKKRSWESCKFSCHFLYNRRTIIHYQEALFKIVSFLNEEWNNKQKLFFPNSLHFISSNCYLEIATFSQKYGHRNVQVSLKGTIFGFLGVIPYFYVFFIILCHMFCIYLFLEFACWSVFSVCFVKSWQLQLRVRPKCLTEKPTILIYFV